MRIRQIKPDYWRDRLLATLSADVREFYIGLWMQSDDSGWMRWEVGELGADLYPYRPVAKRERSIAEWAAELVKAGRIVIHECGHAEIPNLVRHQRLSGAAKQVHTHKREHEIRCSPRIPADSRGAESTETSSSGPSPQLPADSRAAPLIPARKGTVRKGTEGDVGGTTEEDDEQLVESNRALLEDPSQPESVKRAARKYLLSRGMAA